MPLNYQNTFGLLADGKERLVAGIVAEARSKLRGLFVRATTPSEREVARKQIEKETAEQIKRLDSPFNYY